MIRWTLVDSVQAPGDGEHLRLLQRDTEFSIRVGNQELMNSRVFGSEQALAELACTRIAPRPAARVLIGGLGMGYTLAAALGALNADAEIIVAELVPAVVTWNRGPIGHLANHPLNDTRVQIRELDVAKLLRKETRAYDAILLDVDNGPEGLTRKENDWLYELNGLNSAYAALRPGGVLAVWSAGYDPAFTQRLVKVGFDAEEKRVRARGAAGGARHIIWMATRRD
jgi:spermidine synthase